MDDPDTQKKLEKYKLKVKLWERDFKKKHNRIPSKHDIKEARADIKYAYKMYYKLTTSIMENTLNILNDNELNDSLDGNSSQNSYCDLATPISAVDMPSFSNINQLLHDKIQIVNPILERDEGKRIDFEAEAHNDTNEKAWGSHLNRKQNPAPMKKSTQSPSKPFVNTNFKDKILANANFKKRNPRKSFTKSSSTLTSQDSDSQSQKMSFPDFETVLLQKSHREADPEATTVEKSKDASKMHIDPNWCNRMSENGVNGTEQFQINAQSEYSALVGPTTSFGISKLTIESEKHDSEHSVISNSEDESSSFQTHILKRRRISHIDDCPVKTTKTDTSAESLNDLHRETTERRRSGRQSAKRYFNSDSESEPDPFKCSDEEDEFVPEDKYTSPKESKQSKKVTAKIMKKDKPVKETKATRKTNKTEPSNGEVEEKEEYQLPLDVLHDVVPRLGLAELVSNSRKFHKFLVSETRPPDTMGKEKAALPITEAERNGEVARSKLLKKVAAGSLNDNYVRIDINKKIYVRGKKSVNFSRYKKSQWKKKTQAKALSGPEMDMGGCDGGVLTCFQCGGLGHFAQNCKIRADKLLPVEVEDESPFPTLEEAEEMAKNNLLVAHSRNPLSIPASANEIYRPQIVNDDNNETEYSDTNCDESKWEEMDINSFLAKEQPSYIGHKIPVEFLEKTGHLEVDTNDKIQPLYQLNPDGSLPETPLEVIEALKMFGHTDFRFGQEAAVMRILCGMSTLVTLSTGSGKSLCYQLPAYLYKKHQKCITLVVSPLVSLMEDQVHGVPKFLNAQCLHTNQSEKVRQNIINMIKTGTVDVLLLSPEAIVAGEKSTGFGQILKELPPIAFVCIDEAHCVSQWSHNFRPSYLMICRVIKEKLGISTILGLTATATAQTRDSIVKHLDVPDGRSGVISDVPLPENLVLTVSKDSNKDKALLGLLRADRFAACYSIIIYCTRRDQCDRIAGLIRTSLQRFDNYKREEDTSKKRKRLTDLIAEPYHAGMAASRRRTIQNAFMRGELRIVVATIAFGMGINKSDIRGIIHYNMPKSYESYVQEVGRAGRDGKTAHCHLFLEGNDKNELRRHIYANSMDRHVIRKLLKKVFVPCVCGDDKKCLGHEVAFSVESTVQSLDIPEENISTLLCYMELDCEHNIQVLSKGYTMCKVLSYGGPSTLKQAAKQCPALAMAIALDLKRNITHDKSTFIEFPVIDVASNIGWDSGVVKHNLKKLEWIDRFGQKMQRSKITVTFFDLGFRARTPGNLTADELDSALDHLYERVSKQEKTEIIQLHNVFNGLYSVANDTYHAIQKAEVDLERTNCLKETIRHYFQNETFDEKEYALIEENNRNVPQNLDQVSADVHNIISRYPENNFTGRAIARIFHGIASPNYPAVIWGRCKLWRAHTGTDFKTIIQLANNIIIRLRTQ